MCIVYFQTTHFDFLNFDDQAYVTANPRVQEGITAAGIRYAFGSVVDSNWIPLTILSHMAACQLFGMASGAHHAINLLLHVLGALLLFAFLERATHATWPSAAVAAVFAVHPLHVESVAWIAERKDVLSGFLFFLALYLYCVYVERPGRLRYALVLFAYALGLMSKPMVITFPFLLLLLDVWPLRRAKYPRTVLEKIPFLALSLASAAVTYFAQQSGGAVQKMPWGVAFRNAADSYLIYIRQTIWPSGLSAYYPFPKSIPVWEAAVAIGVLGAISAVAVMTWRTRPYIATGWFWFAGTLIPVIGLVQVGAQAHADRYMYLPMVGLTIMAAWGAADLAAKWPRLRTGIAAAAVVGCLLFAVAARSQTAYWQNTETLYKHALSVNADNFFVQYGLADYLLQFPNRGEEALEHFREALRINPESANSHNSIGGYYLQSQRYAEAEAEFKAALRIKPDLAAAHYNLARIYARDPARLEDAVVEYEAAIQAQPDFQQAQRYLGILYIRLGRTRDAIAHLEAAQRIAPQADIAEILSALRLSGQRQR